MANIQTLSVSLVARTQGFQKGLDSAQKRLSAFSTGAVAAGTRIAGFGAAIAGGLAATGLISLTKNAFSAIDELGNLSQRLGIGVEDLQAFQHAATLADVSQQSLATGLQFMNRTLGQASIGSKQAQAAFTRLGLDFQALQAAGPAEAFRIIAERIALVGDRTQQAAAAQAIFGRGGLSLLNILTQGRAGLEASANELKRFGVVVTEQGVAQVQLADDALKRFQATATLGKAFAQVVAPLITEATERFLAWAESGEGASARITSSLQTIINVLSFLGRAVDLIQASFQGFFGLITLGASKVLGFFDKQRAEIARLDSEKFFADAQKNIQDAFGAPGKTAVNEFFDAAQKRAAETVKTLTAPKLTESLTALSKNELAGPQAAKRATDIGQGLQIDLARTVLGSLNAGRRVQQVESPQLAAIVELLRQYLASSKGAGAVAA